MGPDGEALARELALLGELLAGADPDHAALCAAIYLEDVGDLVLPDEEIRPALLDPEVLARLAGRSDEGS